MGQWCSTLKPLRGRIPAQPDLHLRPIEKIRLPLQSRDELPPILAGLQWIGRHPTLQTEIFALLAAGILAGKKVTGRTGMDLGQILVLGVVRRGLDADGDRLEDLANHHLLVRQRLGGPVTPWGADAKVFGQQTLRDNVALRRAHRAVESEIHSLEHPPDAPGLPGRGDAGLSAAGGLRGDELQPARHRAGVAGASASRDGAAGGLKPPHLKPRAKSARRGVAVAGEFQRLGPDRAQNQPCTAHLTPTPPHATCKNGSFRPDTT